MASITNYQHKKFSVKTEEYQHKKFDSTKRKLNEIEKEELTITADFILQQAQKEKNTDLPQIKRKQTKALFRPWEDKEGSNINNVTKRPHSCPPTEVAPQESNSKRRRNTGSALMRRRQQLKQQQAEQWLRQQQYIAYHQQQQQYNAAVMEQTMRNSVYLAYLQQLAQQQRQQQQLFVFGLQH
ncbi:putative transcriptional regulator cudA [Musca domestica]|uniref:Transcriptional regulator cudA n=1 Tax=Musca domestica TaxID=7370 RepID=A0A1I8ND46_MUSDO|nr:putative transcriptional regulator cudA [Musca domestica]